eukprot:scaffold425459_cov48-Prasinocladus_malaysianus.AAC.1
MSYYASNQMLARPAWPREVLRPWEEHASGGDNGIKGKDKVTVPSKAAEALAGPTVPAMDTPTVTHAGD